MTRPAGSAGACEVRRRQLVQVLAGSARPASARIASPRRYAMPGTSSIPPPCAPRARRARRTARSPSLRTTASMSGCRAQHRPRRPARLPARRATMRVPGAERLDDPARGRQSADVPHVARQPDDIGSGCNDGGRDLGGRGGARELDDRDVAGVDRETRDDVRLEVEEREAGVNAASACWVRETDFQKLLTSPLPTSYFLPFFFAASSASFWRAPRSMPPSE